MISCAAVLCGQYIMYSIFLPFAALLLDLATAFVYLKNDFWWAGITTAVISILPLLVSAVLLYSGWTRLQQATILIGFLHSGSQLILQLTLLVRYWNQFRAVLFTYGSIDSPVYLIIIVCCLAGSLVLAKSARECHFICQDPERSLRVTASYFRASPFFLLHVAYRGIALGCTLALLPPWGWAVLLLLLVSANMALCLVWFRLPPTCSAISAFTSLLTPSIYPTIYPLSIATIAKFHIINSSLLTVLICVAATGAFLAVGPLPSCTPLDTPHFPGNSSSTPAPPPPECHAHWSLQFGFLPYIVLAGMFYSVTIITVMGVAKPMWLRLPATTCSTSSLGRKSDSAYSSLDKKVVLLSDESTALLNLDCLATGPETRI